MAQRREVLSLYRKIFHIARSWRAATQSDITTWKEKEYIKDEARTLFKQNKGVVNEKDIREHIKEAETRIEMAVHYQNPYPRMTHIPQTVLYQTGKKMKKQERMMRESKPVHIKSYD